MICELTRQFTRFGASHRMPLECHSRFTQSILIMVSRFRHYLQQIHHSFEALARALPCSCTLCGNSGNRIVCPACEGQYIPLAVRRLARCEICALPLPESANSTQICGKCLQHPPSFDATVVVCHYEAPLDQLVQRLKFGAQLGLAPWMADMLRDALLARSQQNLPDILCPVPLGPQRLIERGYNQALEIARPLSRKLGIRLEQQLCQRLQETRAQSQLPLAERKQNVRNAFSLTPEALGKISGLHIGVIDDVMTTGQTLDAVAAMLKRFGAARVSNFVFARTLPPGESHH